MDRSEIKIFVKTSFLPIKAFIFKIVFWNQKIVRFSILNIKKTKKKFSPTTSNPPQIPKTIH